MQLLIGFISIPDKTDSREENFERHTLKTEMLNHHLKGPRSDHSFKMVD